MSTEPTATTTTQVENTNVPVETQETTPVAAETTPEATTTEETPAKNTETAPAAATEAPNPTPSRSSKRLSILYNKAKKTVTDKLSTEKKPVEKPAEKPAEPVSEEPATTTEAPAEAPAETSEVKTPKSEKRKSFIDTLFRSKSPVKEVEKSEEATPVQEANEAEAPVTTTDKEVTTAETPAAEESAAAETPKEHKNNVMDQFKKSPLGKFFKKKESATEVPKAEAPTTTEEQPTSTEPVAPAEPASEPTPEAAVEAAVEPTTEAAAPAQPEEKPVSRPSSPLGRRLTQIIHKFSPKKKTVIPATEGEVKAEEPAAIAEEPAAPAPTEEPVVEEKKPEPVTAPHPTAVA